MHSGSSNRRCEESLRKSIDKFEKGKHCLCILPSIKIMASTKTTAKTFHNNSREKGSGTEAETRLLNLEGAGKERKIYISLIISKSVLAVVLFAIWQI